MKAFPEILGKKKKPSNYSMPETYREASLLGQMPKTQHLTSKSSVRDSNAEDMEEGALKRYPVS